MVLQLEVSFQLPWERLFPNLATLISGRYRIRNQGLHGCVHWDSQALQSGWLPDPGVHLREALQHHLSCKQVRCFPWLSSVSTGHFAMKPLGDSLKLWGIVPAVGHLVISERRSTTIKEKQPHNFPLANDGTFNDLPWSYVLDSSKESGSFKN